jgi:farnesyl-diphosphate farnesyltransferase
MDGVGEGAEKELLQNFGAVSRVFNTLPEGSRGVIRDITQRMGDGMADYVSVDMGQEAAPPHSASPPPPLPLTPSRHAATPPLPPGSQGTTDVPSYEVYCHSVAGLVGEGLTRCFIARGLETEELAAQGEKVWPFCKPAGEAEGGRTLGLANSMGLFLQKTNIIRDYLEV